MGKDKIKDNELRIGIIGCGKMSRHHVKAVSRISNASIVAAADPMVDPDDPPEWFEKDLKYYKNAGELIAESKPDVLHIVTPPETHHSLAMLALDNGIHV